MLAPLSSTFDSAFGAFKDFFYLKTGRLWDERLSDIKWTSPPVIVIAPDANPLVGEKKDDSAEKKIEHERYHYRAPKTGEPRGILGSVDLEPVEDRFNNGKVNSIQVLNVMA